MANDNHASYTTIGFTVFAGALAVILTLIYIGGLGDRGDELLIETCYDKPVNGLSVGSVVNFRGVKVGEVREIDFIGNKYDVAGVENSRIYILLAVSQKRLGIPGGVGRDFRETIRQLVDKVGLRASVASSGITGLSRIELDYNFGENRTEPAPISWKPANAYIPSKISLLDNFSVAATKVMNQINRMDLRTAWSNVAFAVQCVADMTDSAQTMIQTRQADLERMIDDLSATSESLKGVVSELRRNPSLLIRERIVEPLDETR